MASAQFEIDPGTGIFGAPGVAQNAAAGATVRCRLVSVAGINPNLIAWTIFGTHSSGVVAPTITLSGSPNGQIANFVLGAVAALGQGYGIRCDVNGGSAVTGDANTTAKSAVYVLNAAGRRPFFIGESFERHATHGITDDLNAISLAAVLGGDVTGNYSCPAGVAVREVVYLSSADNCDKADADDATKQPTIGFVISKPTATTAVVQYNGEVEGFVGLVPGNVYFLSATPGQITNVAPSMSGNIVQKLGFAKSATVFVAMVDQDFTVIP